ncbi:mac/perforin domain containing membrane protein, putative [Babesia bigemina]|uniref:Mac/perforin domain containing membrane protein, putative n=1 Tax=Babesia bigemina TaxID=5866 RepID=A0A061D7Z0_BABBI|nr:mac/perforin domain containing membrane protein, putative [Babesia bigemina]CDR95039.1 mac/perforin domain containing membrane protein, putative [Babesia bigemina]|eukprot:XP_012767225.1 mac/perforin domain containing membrane protein, putative [Babesia bigemina]
MQIIINFCLIAVVQQLRLSASSNPHSGTTETSHEKTIDSAASTESNINFKANKIVTGLEYLGSGYDAVKANTLGNLEHGEDLGHRAPIVDFYWARSDVGVTNSLEWLQPLGGWVRPIIACGEYETVTEGTNSSINEDVVQLNAKGDATLQAGGNGSIDVAYDKASKTNVNKSSKVHKNSYYCFTYAAGMPPYLNWNTTEEFQAELEELPATVKEFENCTVKLFKNKAKVCEGMSKWVEFFSLFGTHVTTEIHLGMFAVVNSIICRSGGKITRILTAPSDAVESFSKSGLDVNAAVGAIISGALVDAKAGLKSSEQDALQEFSDSCDLRFSVLGGIHVSKNVTPQSLLKWRATVPLFPMPIRIVVTPIDTFIKKKYKNAYREAFNFYVELSGALPWVVQQHNGIDFNVKTMLNSSYPLAVGSKSGKPPCIECPNHTRILFGFIMEKDDAKKTTTLYRCLSNSSSCFREQNTASQMTIWALCGNSMGLSIAQYAMNFESSAKEKAVKCKAGFTLLTGFILETLPDQKHYIKSATPCNTGSDTCRTDSQLETRIWAVCVDKRFPGMEVVLPLPAYDYLQNVTTLAKSTEISTRDVLGKELRILTGVLTIFINIPICHGESLHIDTCERYTKGCSLTKESNGSCKSLAWGIFLKT